MAITQTAIGRVIPAYVGEWVDNRQYNKLDNVEYLGSTYIALRDNISIEPTGSSAVGVWSLLASKGNSGRIAGAVGTAVRSDEAWVSIITSGDPTDINLEFSFGLPKGDTGAPAAFANAAQSVTSEYPPACRVSISGPPTAATLSFDFDIPEPRGNAISAVDGYAGVGGNIPIYAISYGRNQTETTPGHPALTSDQQRTARENINAAINGNYIIDPGASTEQFLYYSDEGEWIGKSINLVPTGNPIDTGKFLRKTASSMVWAPIRSVPEGGIEGSPLIKGSGDSSIWGSVTTNSEIDAIIDS